ncbi:MAG: glycosyltransferase family 2 protein [Candidatus Woesearchaeota archaeon]
MERETKDKTAIVIAAYNEENAIEKVLDELLKRRYKHLVVVDDASKDGTVKRVEPYLEKGVMLIQHKANKGQGAALRNGINYAVKQGYSYVVTFDGDGQHRVEDLDKMIRPVVQGKADITLGSRFKGKTKMPLGRVITLKIAVVVQWVFYGILLTDAHNGFRCMNRTAASRIRITSDRMEHASEFISEIRRNRLRYKEVPIIVNYTDETLSKGHGSFKQAVNVFFKMLRLKFKRRK